MCVFQFYQRRAPAAGFFRGRAPGGDEWGALQDGTNDLALDADAFAVDDADKTKASCVGFFEICFHHIFHVTRRHGVEVEDIRNRDRMRLHLT